MNENPSESDTGAGGHWPDRPGAVGVAPPPRDRQGSVMSLPGCGAATQGSELEIFLSEGEIVAPTTFRSPLDQRYGVFGVQEGDGSFARQCHSWSPSAA